jgi:lytic murein transglycosylase
MKFFGTFIFILMLSAVTMPASVHAAQCGNNAAGFNAWKKDFMKEARRAKIKKNVLKRALGPVTYNPTVVRLDRNQKSFKLSLDSFMQKRGANQIIAKGKRLKAQNAALLKKIERRYGVPSGVLMAIWGMETAFGGFSGNMSVVRSLATLAYDCRRSAFFTNELIAALLIIQRGDMQPNQMIGAWAGEIGQTQFLASNYLKYAVDFDGNGRRDLIRSKADVLASTANYLKAHGWKAGKGYQQGQRNYRAIEKWNSAGVYQKAIAIIAKKIDG